MRLHGVDAELLDRDEVRALVPYLDFDNARFPIHGGLLQRRGGTARHDAVVWGYARAADARGVDIVQNCQVTGIRVSDGHVSGVETTRGSIRADKVALAVAGSSSRLAAMVGLRLPIESHVIQAFVSEGVKPLIDHVITFGAGHKGGLVFGGDIDGYNSYAQRGNLPTVEDVCEGGMALMPMIGRLRILRSWGGVVDMSMDGSPIIDHTPIDGLYLNAGWCYGGFKATPASGWCFAHLIARDEPHAVAAAYRLDGSRPVVSSMRRGWARTPTSIERLRCESVAPTAATVTCANSSIWVTLLSSVRTRMLPTHSSNLRLMSISATTRPAHIGTSGTTQPVVTPGS
jgi:methylglutamate dehydrogenase subunit A